MFAVAGRYYESRIGVLAYGTLRQCLGTSPWTTEERWQKHVIVPLGLVLLEHLALGVVANVHDVDEAAQVELFGAELSHGDGDMVGSVDGCAMVASRRPR